MCGMKGSSFKSSFGLACSLPAGREMLVYFFRYEPKEGMRFSLTALSQTKDERTTRQKTRDDRCWKRDPCDLSQSWRSLEHGTDT